MQPDMPGMRSVSWFDKWSCFITHAPSKLRDRSNCSLRRRSRSLIPIKYSLFAGTFIFLKNRFAPCAPHRLIESSLRFQLSISLRYSRIWCHRVAAAHRWVARLWRIRQWSKVQFVGDCFAGISACDHGCWWSRARSLACPPRVRLFCPRAIPIGNMRRKSLKRERVRMRVTAN
jgi:hypothetical protein